MLKNIHLNLSWIIREKNSGQSDTIINRAVNIKRLTRQLLEQSVFAWVLDTVTNFTVMDPLCGSPIGNRKIDLQAMNLVTIPYSSGVRYRVSTGRRKKGMPALTTL